MVERVGCGAMAKDRKSSDDVVKTVGLIIGMVVGASGVAFAVSRASPAEIKEVQDNINDVSNRVVAAETNLGHLAEVLREIKEQAALFNENSKEWFRMMHEHD